MVLFRSTIFTFFISCVLYSPPPLFGFLNLFVSCYIDFFLFILFSLFIFFLHASLLLSPFMYFSLCYVFVRTLMLMNQQNKCSLMRVITAVIWRLEHRRLRKTTHVPLGSHIRRERPAADRCRDTQVCSV